MEIFLSILVVLAFFAGIAVGRLLLPDASEIEASMDGESDQTDSDDDDDDEEGQQNADDEGSEADD